MQRRQGEAERAGQGRGGGGGGHVKIQFDDEIQGLADAAARVARSGDPRRAGHPAGAHGLQPLRVLAFSRPALVHTPEHDPRLHG
ncbi:hypothetical protein D3C71_1871470 [compost metagenome]